MTPFIVLESKPHRIDEPKGLNSFQYIIPKTRHKTNAQHMTLYLRISSRPNLFAGYCITQFRSRGLHRQSFSREPAICKRRLRNGIQRFRICTQSIFDCISAICKRTKRFKGTHKQAQGLYTKVNCTSNCDNVLVIAEIIELEEYLNHFIMYKYNMYRTYTAQTL